MVKLLVDAGANLDIPGRYGNTPLHSSIGIDCLEIMTYLIELGADLRVLNHENRLPLYLFLDLLSLSNSEFGISQDFLSLVPPSQLKQSASPRTVAPVTLAKAREKFIQYLWPLMDGFMDGGQEFDAVIDEIFKPDSGIFFLGFNEDKHGLIVRVGDNTLDIFNSGFGLDYGHMAIGKKWVTVVHLEVDEGDDGRYRKSADDIINDIRRLSTVKELYELTSGEESRYRVGRLSVNDKAQRHQKESNCYIECYFSYFRQVLSDEVYLK
jgi:FOG: Ankyrin repeat